MNKIALIYILLFLPFLIYSQEKDKSVRFVNTQQQNPVVEHPFDVDKDIAQDTILRDTTIQDSLVQDTTVVIDTMEIDSVVPPVIEAPINYNADDSILVSFDGQKIFLYNNAKVTYQEIELTAYYIELDMETKEVYAEGILDSTETLTQKPIFKDGDQEFESKTLRYNFETKKGIITEVVTQQGEGYFHSERTKKISDKVFLATQGKYTTCDAEHPHFYLHLSKAKVISNNKIITGPAYLVLEDFPIYFPVLPFGYFPSTPTYSSGIIIPSYGEESTRGFFLKDGGYYWAANEYFDLALRGDIYSKGSWASKIHTNYKNRYKYSGSFDFKYNVNKYGEKETDTYYESNQFAITWSHSQDAKANPNQSFSASVNFSTSGYDKQNSLSSTNYLTTTKSSSVSYSKKFENTPFNMSMNLRHSQNSTDSTITLSIPEMTFSMSKVYPFRSKKQVGPNKWYQNFSINYTGNMKNSITAEESEILHKSITKDWKNGIKHSIPISLPSFSLFNYWNVSPSFSYNEKWYFKKNEYYYDPTSYYYDDSGDSSYVHVNTITGLNRVYNYSYSLSSSTNIYGTYRPKNPNSRINAIRHKMTPTIGLSYTPDFGAARYGYWKEVQVDSTGATEWFDVNDGGIYGDSPSRGASGAISFSLTNNVEMKVLNKKRNMPDEGQQGNMAQEGGDASGVDDDESEEDSNEKFKKVKLIDNLSFSGSYNLIADSLNLSTISMRARTTIKGVSVNMSGTLDPYMINENGTRINKFAWNERSGIGRLGRLTRASISFGMQFKSKQGQEQAKQNQQMVNEQNIVPGNYEDYYDFNVPWNFSFNYSFSYSGASKLGGQGSFSQTMSLSGNVNLTEKWGTTMSTNFDIMAGEFSYTTFNVTRDLHCWQMSFNFVPFGDRKSYSFTINAKSSILKDLKLTKNRSYYDNY